MQSSGVGRLGLTVIAALAAWELGQVVATYLVIGYFGEQYQLAFAPGGGFDQLDTLLVLFARLAIAAIFATPVILLLNRFLWRDGAQ